MIGKVKKNMAKKQRKVYDNEFRNNAVQYVKDHPDLSRKEAAKNLGVGESTLNRWLAESKKSDSGQVEMRGTGNYASDEAKEIARLKRELRDTQDALEVLKKAISILGK